MTKDGSAATWRAHGIIWAIPSALTQVGRLAARRHEYATAQVVLEEAVTLLRQAGDRLTGATGLTLLAEVVHRVRHTRAGAQALKELSSRPRASPAAGSDWPLFGGNASRSAMPTVPWMTGPKWMSTPTVLATLPTAMRWSRSWSMLSRISTAQSSASRASQGAFSGAPNGMILTVATIWRASTRS